MDSTVSVDNASKINPTWLIVLYAYNLFILDCVKPRTDPIIKDNKLLTMNIFFQVYSKNPICTNRSINKPNIDILAIIAT